MDLMNGWCAIVTVFMTFSSGLAFGQMERSANTPTAPILPSKFYVVIETKSDASPFWSHFVLDLQPSGSNTVVRYIRIAPFRACPRIVTVNLAEARIEGRTPGTIVAGNNPCAVDPGELARAMHKYRAMPRIYDTAAYGIVADCGGRERVLHLPYPEEVDLVRLQTDLPSIARLWHIASEVRRVTSHDTSPFSKLTAQQDWEYQLAGQAAIPELRSGRVDKGFHKTGGLRKDLVDYRGPYTGSGLVQLENAKSYHFEPYTEPQCPREVLAGLAWGYVQLELTVNVQTGEVLRAVPKWAGDQTLVLASVEAAQTWRFVPASLKSDKLIIGLFFHGGCSSRGDSD